MLKMLMISDMGCMFVRRMVESPENRKFVFYFLGGRATCRAFMYLLLLLLLLLFFFVTFGYWLRLCQQVRIGDEHAQMAF
ncbi:hypothetical protein DsansV1_C23g0179701 [Dioscorea sansibarensis]